MARNIDMVRQQIRETLALTPRPSGVNLDLEFAQEERLVTCLDERVPVISVLWRDPSSRCRARSFPTREGGLSSMGGGVLFLEPVGKIRCRRHCACLRRDDCGALAISKAMLVCIRLHGMTPEDPPHASPRPPTLEASHLLTGPTGCPGFEFSGLLRTVRHRARHRVTICRELMHADQINKFGRAGKIDGRNSSLISCPFVTREGGPVQHGVGFFL